MLYQEIREQLEKELENIYRDNLKKFPPPPFDFNIDETKSKAISYIKEIYMYPEFKKEIFNILKEKLKLDLKESIIKKEEFEDNYLSFIEEIKDNRIIEFHKNCYFNSVEEYQNSLKNLTLDNTYDFILKKYKVLIKILNQNGDFYFFFTILDLLIKNYKKIQEPYYKINDNNNKLKNTYDYLTEENQYKKYGLLKLNRNLKLMKIFKGSFPDYLHDERCGYIALDNSLNKEVLEQLSILKNKNYIKDLSLRPNYYVELQKKDIYYCIKAKDFGKYFTFENLKEIIPTKLYNLNGDSLWINIENNNITFEELLNNFEIEEDFIITQVLHCEYFEQNNKYYISHLDHEFILYSLEEYDKRKNNIKQKGNSCKRVKTFKIDNSSIPFILEDGLNILLFFLNQYFKSKDLLKEYFIEIENSRNN
jgi:hypothetical protein